jgi:N,N'-diacetylchitobiose transport system permease protein
MSSTGRRLRPRTRLTANALGLLLFVACCFPVYWMVSTSFQSRNEIRSPDPTWHPFGGSFDNYRHLFEDGEFIDAL